ncbi:hypothetical protein DL768_010298 [Monosporascus sp. mg162]|nr:hypothetical protein DL768_010298 [Monosporascus sp. mg162]
MAEKNTTGQAESFDLDEENRLRGSDNWEMWKIAFWVALMAIGYRDGDSAKLTRTDEAKLAAAVIANVKEGPMAVVAGLTKGTEMFKTLERSYGAKGIDQQMDLWIHLQYAKWKRGSALDHVVEFKRLVRRCNELEMPVNSGQQVTMFIHSIRDQDVENAARWKSRMKGTLRQHPTTTVSQVYDDFVAEFRAIEMASPLWNKKGKLLCFNCGEYGYMAKDCPKAKRSNNVDDDDESRDGKQKGQVYEAQFIPDGLEDLYGQPLKKYQAGY